MLLLFPDLREVDSVHPTCMPADTHNIHLHLNDTAVRSEKNSVSIFTQTSNRNQVASNLHTMWNGV